MGGDRRLPELSENGEAGNSGHAVGDGPRLVEHNWTHNILYGIKYRDRQTDRYGRQTDR